MKFTKIFAIAFAAMTMTACSDDDNGLNSASGVTVDFEGATMEVNEDEGFFEIPVMVTGEPNGEVKVTIEVVKPADDDETSAKDGVDYIITNNTIRIPAGESVGSFEVRSIWEQGVVTPDKPFTVKITKVEGAEIGSINEATITIVNIDNTYTALLGRWTLTGTNYRTGEAVTWSLNLQIPSNPDEEEVGHLVNAFGYQEDDDMFIPIWFDVNDNNGEVEYVGIPLDYLTSNYYYNFGTSIGYALLCTSSIYNGSFVQSGDIEGTINDEHNEITFDSTYPLVNRLIGYPSFDYLGYTYGTGLTDIKLTRN